MAPDPLRPQYRQVLVLLLQLVGPKELIASCALHPDISMVLLLYLVAPLAAPPFSMLWFLVQFGRRVGFLSSFIFTCFSRNKEDGPTVCVV